jgi:hypothetical protein
MITHTQQAQQMIVAFPALNRELQSRFEAVLNLTSAIWIDTEHGGLYEQLVAPDHHMWTTLTDNVDDLLTLVDFISRSFGDVVGATLASEMLRRRSEMILSLATRLEQIERLGDPPF